MNIDVESVEPNEGNAGQGRAGLPCLVNRIGTYGVASADGAADDCLLVRVRVRVPSYELRNVERSLAIDEARAGRRA